MNTKRILTAAAYAFVGWALCGATVGIGMAVTSLQTTLIIHAIAAPAIFIAVSWFYFRRQGAYAPLAGTMVILTAVLALDFFVVALLLHRSLAMFESPLGTWIPLTAIGTATYGTALVVRRSGIMSRAQDAHTVARP